jgi:gliding motility-associated-like protein
LATTLGATFPVNIPAPGIYNFYAQIFNPNTRCVSPLTPVVVNNAPRPPAPLLTTDTICQPGSILLRALHAGSGNYTYRWFRINPTLAIGQSTSSTFSVASASPGQRFAVVYTAEGSNCASDTAYVTVQQGGFRQVNVTVNPMAVCQNGITTFTFSGLTTGQTVFIFADSLRQILIGTTVGNSSYQTPPISSNIRFYFSFQSDSNGCNVIPISLAITVLPKPVAPMLRVDTICGTATTVLRAFNALAPTGTLYNWYTGNPPVFIQQTLADTLSTNAQPGQTFAVAIVNSTTGCISDTIYATPPVGFKPLNVFALPDKVCPNGITSIFFSNLTQNQTAFIYADTLREIQLGSTQGPGTFITPPITSESRFYFTFEADSAGCFTKPFSLAIRVVNKPIVQWQSNLPKLICSTLADTQAYAVIGALNSRFEWYLPTGNIAMPIGRTDSSYILIKWIERTDSARVLVQEIGVDDCISDTISLTVQFENSSPKLERVTTALIDDKNIEVFHKTLSVKSAFKPEVFLYRDAELLAALPLIDDFYTDFDLNTGETAYTYHIKLINACGDTISSESITNTVLTKKREGDSFLLTWNGPTELNIPPYERSLNHNPSFSAEFQILEYINTTTNTAIWSFDNALNEPCFRMRFRINDNAEAKEVLSNRVCDLILPELMLPNLITANGDGVNDTFELKFIRFYQPITLEVFNRWGKKVYENAAYNNDWDVSSLPSGLYYYKINLSANQAYPKQQRVGWVQVVK